MTGSVSLTETRVNHLRPINLYNSELLQSHVQQAQTRLISAPNENIGILRRPHSCMRRYVSNCDICQSGSSNTCSGNVYDGM